MGEKEIGGIKIVEERRAAPTEILLQTAHSPTYPLFVLQIRKEGKETPEAVLTLRPEIYDFLVKRYGTKEILIYCGFVDGGIEAWSPDMQFTIRLLGALSIMSETRRWISAARDFATNFLTDRKVPPGAEVPQGAIEKITDILRAAGVLEELRAAQPLLMIAKDVLSSGLKDLDSITYRLAMTLYHSKRMTGTPALPRLEDPAALYLSMVESGVMLAKYRLILDEFEKLAPPARAPVAKTFIAFLAGAYLAFTALSKS